MVGGRKGRDGGNEREEGGGGMRVKVVEEEIEEVNGVGEILEGRRGKRNKEEMKGWPGYIHHHCHPNLRLAHLPKEEEGGKKEFEKQSFKTKGCNYE